MSEIKFGCGCSIGEDTEFPTAYCGRSENADGIIFCPSCTKAFQQVKSLVEEIKVRFDENGMDYILVEQFFNELPKVEEDLK